MVKFFVRRVNIWEWDTRGSSGLASLWPGAPVSTIMLLYHQPMADNYALATDKQTGKQKDHIVMSA